MATRAQKIRLGIFMLLSFLLLFGSVGVLAGMRLWNPRDAYFIRYQESVSGLEIGASVKMKGVRVGRVEKVTVAKGAESVVVDLALTPKTPVTQDTTA
ncbi:MAG: MCE family protein, partial [Deltaproteobacteria bacterium]|nr:MCE family protein [Deltaproteobacteria bacterium]